MKQTTLTQRLLSAIVALCMVLSVCAPALAAEASAAVITLTKNGKTTGLTPDNVAEALPKCTMSVNGSKVTLDLSNNKNGNLLSDAVLTAANSGTDLELVCGYGYVTAITNPVVITGMHDITLRGDGMAGSLKIENCNGEVFLTAQNNRVVLGSLNINNTAGTGGVTITGSHRYPLCNDANGNCNTVITSNGPVKIENELALLEGVGTLVGPATRGLTVTQSSSVDVTGASGDYATIIGNADITSDGAVTITNTQGTAVGGELNVNAGDAVTVTGYTVDATKAAIAKGANITAGGSVNVSNSGGIAVDGGLTVNNTSGDVTVTSKGEYALKGITTITSNGAVNITSNGGQVSDEKLTVNKSSGVTVTAVSDEEAFFYRSTPRFVNTPKVEIRNKGTKGWVGTVEYVPPAGMGSIYYTSSASNAEKTHTHGTGDSYHTVKAYFRIESAALYTLLTQPKGVTATTGSTQDTKFYAGETVTVTAPADTETKKFDQWTCGGTKPTGLPNGWETRNPLTFTMPEGNVELYASYRDTTKYKVNVTGGIIVEPQVSDKHTGFFKPGTEVTVAFANSGIEDFKRWKLSGTTPKGFPRGWQNSKEFTFTMPAGNVILTAECKTAYTLTVDGGTIVNGTNTGNYLPGTKVTVTAPADTETKKFEQWTLSGTEPTDLPDGWEHKPSFSFTMPAGNVTLTADYKQLYNLTVNGGTIVDESGDTGETTGIYLPGTKVTIRFTESTDIEMQFEKWTFSGTEPTGLPDGWQNSPKFTFTMPAGDVALEAEYKTVYNVSVDDGKGTILVNGVEGSRALAGDEITVTETGSDEHHLFSSWQFTSSTALVTPDEGWEHKPSFSFTMPAGNVTLTADYKQLYDLTVNGGTIVDGDGDTGIYLPGTEVTIQFTESDDITKQFEKWTYTGTAPAAPDGGWPDGGWQNSPDFTFKMPEGNVTLKAECKTVYNVSVDEGRGSFTVNGAARTQALEGETVTVKTSDAFFNDHRQFNGWSLSGDSAQMVEPSENWENSETFTFTMPAGNVSLKADYKQLYDLTVKGGTIEDESGSTDSGVYLPGTQVTVHFTESTDIAKQFKQWTYEGTRPEAPEGTGSEGGWDSSKEKKDITFTMPTGDVTLKAEYKDVYTVSVENERGTVLVNGEARSRALEGETVTVKASDTFFDAYHEFDGWQLTSSTALVEPSENWENSKTFTFKMPAGNVSLKADYKQLYDVTVTGGTIEGGTDDNGIYKKIVKPGELVTVRAESTEENPFQQWTNTGTEPEAPDGGWTVENWETSREFTFKMPSGNVTLEAQRDQLYKVSINDNLGSVTINGEPLSSLWVKEGDTVTVATTLKDGYWMEFEKWNSTGTAPEEPEGGWTETNKSTSTTFTFKMPNGPVELVAQWSASSLDPDQPIDPDEPLDEDFGVEPDTTGGTIAAVAVGGAAIWGGYEIATRVILHSLLPEGTAIPANRGQLALLVWNTAGRPEPAGAPAFADVTDPDMAKAAQWCTEQGTMAAKGDRFEPEGWTPKFKVIEVWNKTFPAA